MCEYALSGEFHISRHKGRGTSRKRRLQTWSPLLGGLWAQALSALVEGGDCAVLPLLGHMYLASGGGTLLFPPVARAILVGMAAVVEDKERRMESGVGVWVQ